MLFQANCWNCGRQASETCSGCNAARYCSQFCQHKDWEGHHKVCAVAKKVAASVATSTASAATAAMASVAGIKKRDEAGDDGDDEDEVCFSDNLFSLQVQYRVTLVVCDLVGLT